ncbi:MAG: hypothetical protein EOO56_20120 [Hymenobacter sp.]|nr:MAG: hypothetical protein EOO56_20120 [Hymenobacter sp.]
MKLLSTLSFRKRSPLPAPAAATPAPDPEPVEAAPVAVAPSVAQAQAKELVSRVAHELPAFIAVAVLEADTGTILAGQWAGHSGGAVEAAAANAEIVRQTGLVIEALHLAATEQLTDILITLRQQLHLLRVLPQSGWLLYLAVRAQDTNPALARAVTQLVDE